MIEIQNETLLTLRDAARRIPSTRQGRGLHIGTVYRWASRGIRGIKLESVRLGGVLFTSVEAIQRFGERCSSPLGENAPINSTTVRARQIRMANTVLDEAEI